MITEYALVRLESIAFGGILPTDVAPYTDLVHITIGEVTLFTAWWRLSPRIVHEYLEH